MIYAKEERDEQLRAMRRVASHFYSEAVRTNVHAFVEFCGLMNNFIDICARTSEAGQDYNEANVHCGEKLVAEKHNIAYLAEKLECIYGTTLEDPEMRETFMEAMGWGTLPEPPPSARPLSEWHEDMGSVLWWKLPVEEPPYAGTPLDEDFPEYMTHWTPVPLPSNALEGAAG